MIAIGIWALTFSIDLWNYPTFQSLNRFHFGNVIFMYFLGFLYALIGNKATSILLSSIIIFGILIHFDWFWNLLKKVFQKRSQKE